MTDWFDDHAVVIADHCLAVDGGEHAMDARSRLTRARDASASSASA